MYFQTVLCDSEQTSHEDAYFMTPVVIILHIVCLWSGDLSYCYIHSHPGSFSFSTGLTWTPHPWVVGDTAGQQPPAYLHPPTTASLWVLWVTRLTQPRGSNWSTARWPSRVGDSWGWQQTWRRGTSRHPITPSRTPTMLTVCGWSLRPDTAPYNSTLSETST